MRFVPLLLSMMLAAVSVAPSGCGREDVVESRQHATVEVAEVRASTAGERPARKAGIYDRQTDRKGWSPVRVLADRSFDDDSVLLAFGLPPVPDWAMESNSANAQFGFSVASAGDVNGDGYSDVVVGSPFYGNYGRAFLYLGSASGLSSVQNWTVFSVQSFAELGTSVASAGDVNDDGYDDVIVGVPEADANGLESAGKALLYLGSSTGLRTSPSWTTYGSGERGHYGRRVASAGDIDADGYSDIIVGEPDLDVLDINDGRASVYLGSPTGPATTPDWVVDASAESVGLGHAVASAGDVNGDGYDDVVVGEPHFTNGGNFRGRALLFLGSADGLSVVPDWNFQGDFRGEQLGSSTASAGDVNGDGYDDVIVGGPSYTASVFDTGQGRALVFHGSTTGLSPTPDWTYASTQNRGKFGWSVSSAGDINVDGYDDVIVGAYGYSNGQGDEGRAYVFFGSATGLSSTPAWIYEPDIANAYAGYSVTSAGDVNGDDFNDLVIGMPDWRNGETAEGAAVSFYGGFVVTTTTTTTTSTTTTTEEPTTTTTTTTSTTTTTEEPTTTTTTTSQPTTTTTSTTTTTEEPTTTTTTTTTTSSTTTTEGPTTTTTTSSTTTSQPTTTTTSTTTTTEEPTTTTTSTSGATTTTTTSSTTTAPTTTSTTTTTVIGDDDSWDDDGEDDDSITNDDDEDANRDSDDGGRGGCGCG